MADFALKADPLEELRQLADPPPDRLPAMLFLAALLHGILIIGVTFNPAMLEDFSDAISLEVTIVADPDQDIDRPDRAEYLAQASQEGGGNTAEQVRRQLPRIDGAPGQRRPAARDRGRAGAERDRRSAPRPAARQSLRAGTGIRRGDDAAAAAGRQGDAADP
jgi:protein TonB